MIMNEYIFLVHTSIISIVTLGALRFGKEALTVLIVLQTILANLFITKQIVLFGFHVTPTDAFTIGAVTAINFMQEYYGVKATRTVLWMSFSTALFFNVMAQLHLAYIPSIYDTNDAHFQAVLYSSARILAASLTSYVLSQTIEYRLYEILKKKFGVLHMIIRASTSTLIAQLFDTILFSFLGLYGIVQSVVDIIIVSYCIKVVVLVLTFPTIWLSKYCSKKYIHEHV